MIRHWVSNTPLWYAQASAGNVYAIILTDVAVMVMAMKIRVCMYVSLQRFDTVTRRSVAAKQSRALDAKDRPLL